MTYAYEQSSSWESKKGFEGFLNEPQVFDIIKKLAFFFLEKKSYCNGIRGNFFIE